MRYLKYFGLFALLTAILSLAGCVTPEQRLNMARNQCESFGFAPGSTSYAQCIQKQNNEMVRNDMQEQSNFQQQRIADSIQQKAIDDAARHR